MLHQPVLFLTVDILCVFYHTLKTRRNTTVFTLSTRRDQAGWQ